MSRSDEFLRDYYKDCREEMRGRRELEFRLVQLLLVFCPIVVTGMVAVYNSDIDSTLCKYLSYGVSAFVLLVSLLVTYRVIVEHRAYADMGRTIQKIWRYFELFDKAAYLSDDSILPDWLGDSKKGFGQGRGYIRTLGFVWAITITVIVLILAFGVFKK